MKIEPVYTGKMFYGLYDLLLNQPSQAIELAGKKIVAVHTGGLQGLRGMSAKLEKLQIKEKRAKVRTT